MRTAGCQVYAEGQPIDMAVAMQAAEWLATLMSGEVTACERQQWQAWRDAHPDHERAWTHIEKISGGLQALDARASRQALAQRPRTASRRQALSMLGSIAAIGLATWGGARTQAARSLMADFSTPMGQRRSVTLADGSVLLLNGDSAVNLHFDQHQRLLQLIKGEVFISTAHETGALYRPFLVETVHGQAQALGTRYSVRQDNGGTSVAVEHGAVRLTPRQGGASASIIVHAGQASSMTGHTAQPAHAVSSDIWGWRHGLLLADDMPLRDFLHELSRYRHGFLGCDDAVADLRISGVFPLADTEAVLMALPNSLPVDIRLRTRYWVQVEPRAPS